MPDYVLLVDGPRPMKRYINARDDKAAMALATDAVVAGYGWEDEDDVLASRVTVTSDGGDDPFAGTVAEMIGVKLPPR